MMDMNCVVVYESILTHRGHRRSGRSGLRANGDVDMRAVGDEPAVGDLLVVGAPTHAHGLPATRSRKAIVAAVEEAKSKGTPLDYTRRLAWGRFSTVSPRSSREGGLLRHSLRYGQTVDRLGGEDHGEEDAPPRLRDRRRTGELFR